MAGRALAVCLVAFLAAGAVGSTARAAGCRQVAVACAMTDVAVPARLASPSIRSGGDNPVPACVTPALLMQFVGERKKARTGSSTIDARFRDLGDLYRRFGEEHEVRWDYAFFQMMIETGNLSFTKLVRQDGRTEWVPAEVRPEQMNFAGLGATKETPGGERFDSSAAGVEAHIKHLVVYSGRPVSEPMASRTCEVQASVLACTRAIVSRPITFADMTRMWSHKSEEDAYAQALRDIACRFAERTGCKAVCGQSSWAAPD